MLLILLVFMLNIPNMMTFVIERYPARHIQICVLEDSEFLQWAMESYNTSTDELLDDYILDDLSEQYHEDIFFVIATRDAQHCVLLNVAFWSNGMLFKLIPCIILTILIGCLLKILREVNERRKKLGVLQAERKRANSNVGRNSCIDRVNTAAKASPQRDSTTIMLTTVLAVFLITELPQGVTLILTGVFNDPFRVHVYQNLGDLMDLLSLINSAVNFVIYCTMSQKFRTVFLETLCPTAALTQCHRCPQRPTVDKAHRYAAGRRMPVDGDAHSSGKTSVVLVHKPGTENGSQAEVVSWGRGILDFDPPGARFNMPYKYS